MKERYLDTMSRVVNVYSPERFRAYIEKVRTEGITEHGFPRLCANIGILMAHGRNLELKDRFEEMMALCCRDIPAFCPKKGKRGNDFSVRELVSCILELEQAKIYPTETIAEWKNAMSVIIPKDYYRMVAPEPPVAVDNWAAFNAASEQIRCAAGLADTHAYIENQIASQMLSFDDNGMYRDPNDPMVYDVVTRNMLSTCLYYGYNGSHKPKLEKHLRKAGDLTLLMQSVTGELAYGGRSNQFLHNEAHLAACFEFEASQRKLSGDTAAASRFKAAAGLALGNIIHWLDTAPGQHIKNYFPIDSMIGCENYAYYDKYMVTVASFLYLAYRFCDETVTPSTCPAADDSSHIFVTSDAFRKAFCKSGPYFLEAELCSDPHYDASGIGRIHRRGAPSVICLSVPASVTPNYKTERSNPLPLSICCGALTNGKWEYSSEPGGKHLVKSHDSSRHQANLSLCCELPSGKTLQEDIFVTKDGIHIVLRGDGNICMLLPAFIFDGKTSTLIECTQNMLRISYKGWNCLYETSGTIQDQACICGNRNGNYKLYRAEALNELHIHIQIEPV